MRFHQSGARGIEQKVEQNVFRGVLIAHLMLEEIALPAQALREEQCLGLRLQSGDHPAQCDLPGQFDELMRVVGHDRAGCDPPMTVFFAGSDLVAQSRGDGGGVEADGP